MKELVVLEKNNNEAMVCLVDYDTYTVQTKRVELAYVDTLISSGKASRVSTDLLVYGDYLLAIDSVRGCLYVSFEGTSYVQDLRTQLEKDVLQRVLLKKGTFPRIFMTDSKDKSFSEIVIQVMEEKHAGLESKEVTQAILERTGVLLSVNIQTTWGGVDACYVTIRSLGKMIDKLVLSNDSIKMNGGELYCSLQGGSIDELYVQDFSKVNVGIEYKYRISNILDYCVINTLYVGEGVEKLILGSMLSISNLKAIGEVNTTLSNLQNYNGVVADLQAFQSLNSYLNCWSYDKLTPVTIKLANVEAVEFNDCFSKVDFKELEPYRSISGQLDLTGIVKVQDSFIDFVGISSICGKGTAILSSFKLTVSTQEERDCVSKNHVDSVNIESPKVNDSFLFRYESSRLDSPTDFLDSLCSRLTCTIKLNVDSTAVTLGESPYSRIKNYSVYYWNIVMIVCSQRMLYNLTLHIKNYLRYKVEASVRECSFYTYYGSYEVTEEEVSFKHVAILSKGGSKIYENIDIYGDRCYEKRHMESMYVCVLPEGLREIRRRAFYATEGIKYLVIPKSCASIGTAAFSGMRYNSDVFTTVCVYRDSYAHKWSKGKNLNVMVIDSIEDIPKEQSRETEDDFLAAFMDVPSWANESKVFVAKLLAMTTEDILSKVKVVATLTKELQDYFQEVLSAYIHKNGVEKTIFKLKGSNSAEDCSQECKKGNISRGFLIATALNAVYGSCIDLLDKDILSDYIWYPYQIHEVMLYVGEPRFTDKTQIYVYLHGNEVLYIGCGKNYRYQDDSLVNEIPQEVLTAENLLGPDMIERFHVSYWNSTLIHVYNEYLHGDVADLCYSFLTNSMVVLEQHMTQSIGGKCNLITYVYDVMNEKLYKFSVLQDTKSTSYYLSIGTFLGEVDLEELPNRKYVLMCHECNSKKISRNLLKAKPAPVCADMEFCSKYGNFDLLGKSPKTAKFIEFLNNSLFVASIKRQRFYNNNLALRQIILADSTMLTFGKSDSSSTYYLGITSCDNKNYYFEAAFNMLDFAEKVGHRVYGKEFSNEIRYKHSIAYEDVVAVTIPTKRHNYVESEIFLGYDLTSGKLVLCYGEKRNSNYCTVCAFDTAEDALAFCKGYSLNVLKPTKLAYKAEKLLSMLDICTIGGETKLCFTSYGSFYDKNALLMIGEGLEAIEDTDNAIYSTMVLKYCRI